MLMDHSAEPFADTAPSTGPGVVRALWSATISMFRRRWRIFAVVAIVTFVVAAALILMMPWKYQAVARVKIDPSPSAALDRCASLPLRRMTAFAVLRHSAAASVVTFGRAS